MKYKLLYYSGKRPNNSINELRKEVIIYLQKESKKGHFPSKRELHYNFNMNISAPIEKLYSEAGIEYQPAINQHIKVKKASILLKIVLDNLHILGLLHVKHREIRERGIDIVTKKGKEKIGIELKAYNKHETLKAKDIAQVNRFIEKEGLDRAILITTTEHTEVGLTSTNKIRIIKGKELKNIINNEKYKKQLEYILNFSSNRENVQKQIKRKKILEYVSRKFRLEGKKASCLDIQINLHMDVSSYFKGLSEIYKILGILPPTRKMRGPRAKNPDQEIIEMWKDAFKLFIMEELIRGNKYPSGKKIGNKFGISHIWNIVKVSELYSELGVKPYGERGTGSRKKTTSSQGVLYENKYPGAY